MRSKEWNYQRDEELEEQLEVHQGSAILLRCCFDCFLQLFSDLGVDQPKKSEVTLNMLECRFQTDIRGGVKVMPEWCKDRVEVERLLPEHLAHMLVRMEEFQPRNRSLSERLFEEGKWREDQLNRKKISDPLTLNIYLK